MNKKYIEKFKVSVYQDRDQFADMLTDGEYHNDWKDPSQDDNCQSYIFSNLIEAELFAENQIKKLYNNYKNMQSCNEVYAAVIYKVGPRGGLKFVKKIFTLNLKE